MALAQQHRVTLNTIFQGAWALVLGRMGDHRDVVFGATFAGRPPEIAGIETMVGIFINTLPIRVRLDPDQDLGSWLASLQTWNLDLQQVDDSRLFDLHRWSELSPGQPLFECALLFQSYPPLRTTTLGDLERELGVQVGGFRAFGQTSYPLTVTVKPKDRISLGFAYDPARFDSVTVRRLQALTVHFLKELVRKPEAKLRDLCTLDPAQRHQQLVEWNEPLDAPTGSRDLLQAFAQQARQAPDAVAVVAEGVPALTYGELARRAARLAGRLRRHGVGCDVPVGLFLNRSVDAMVALLGILYAGGAYVPLDPLLPAKRLDLMLRELHIRLVLSQGALRDSLPAATVDVLLVDQRSETLAPEDLPLEKPTEHASVPGSALAYVLYTSGSTGRPKAVGITRDALSSYVAWAGRRFNLGPDRRVLQFASLGFDTSAEEIFSTLTTGGTLVLRNEHMLESPEVFLQRVADWQVDVLDLPTAYWHRLCSALGQGHRLPDRVQTVIIGGEAARVDRLKQWHAGAPTARLINTYGPTEATIVACDRDLSDPDYGRAVPIGFPVPGSRALVVDRDLNPVPIGVVGELCIGGDRLARGYLGRAALTAAAFLPDPFSTVPGARLYRTGDLVRRRHDGALEFIGRRDHQIKLRGLRIELGEIESAVLEHGAVRDAVVVVERTGESESLVVYFTAGEPVGSSSLREHVKARLPHYMVPARSQQVAELPRTVAGKVDRKALTAMAAPHAPERSSPPKSPTESALAELFAEVLNIETVGVHDEYFELGGDSLLAVRLMARIERRFGVGLTLAELFTDFTVTGVARLLDRIERFSSNP